MFSPLALTMLPPVVGTRLTDVAFRTTFAYDIEFVTRDCCCVTDTPTAFEYELKSLPQAVRQRKSLSLSHTDIAQLLPRSRALCEPPTDEYPLPNTRANWPPDAAISPEPEPPPGAKTLALATACMLYENKLDTDGDVAIATDTKPPTRKAAPAMPRQRMLDSDTHKDDWHADLLTRTEPLSCTCPNRSAVIISAWLPVHARIENEKLDAYGLEAFRKNEREANDGCKFVVTLPSN